MFYTAVSKKSHVWPVGNFLENKKSYAHVLSVHYYLKKNLQNSELLDEDFSSVKNRQLARDSLKKLKNSNYVHNAIQYKNID